MEPDINEETTETTEPTAEETPQEELTEEQMLADLDMEAHVTRGEMIAIMQNMASDIEGIVQQFNTVVQQLMANQRLLDERVAVLEDPARPKIYIP